MQCIKVITEGKGKIPGYEKRLSGDQFKGLVEGIRGRGREK